MPLLAVSNIKKSFVERTLFEGISFEIDASDKVGLVGANGCGKTTLLNIISKRDVPDEGSVYISRDAVIGTMQQHTDDGENTLFESVLSVFDYLEQIERKLDEINAELERGEGSIDALIAKQHRLNEEYERQGGLTYKSRARAAALGLGFTEDDLSRPMSSFSGGQRNKVQLAKLLLSEANLLLLDEPTNHLDIESVEWLEDFLRSYRKAFIVISHDRYFLDKVTAKTIEIKDRTIYATNGNYSRHIEKRATDREIQMRQYLNTQKEIRRIYGIVEQQRRWGQERNFVTAASKLKQIERLKATLVEPERDLATVHFGFSAKEISGNDVLMGHGIRKSYGAKHVLNGIDLHVLKGERIFIVGANGCGKTTLLKILARTERPDAGYFNFGANVEAAYYDQTLSQLNDGNTVLNEAWDDHYLTMTQTQIRSTLAAFLFRGDDIEKKVGCLSGGEKARLQLLKLMLSKANLLLLDEPTNHLDIASREALERALENYGGTMIVVTHDRYLINRLADKVLYMDNGVVSEHIGGYDELMEDLERKKVETVVEADAQRPRQNDYRAQKERQSAINRQKGEVRRSEERIAALEGEIAAMEKELAKPTVASDYKKAGELSAKIDSRRAELNGLYEAWDEAQRKLDEMEGKS
ncbi:MAG: ABC-F family ATP-binding cassette domain-containing protein [Christensenellales bacterium]